MTKKHSYKDENKIDCKIVKKVLVNALTYSNLVFCYFYFFVRLFTYVLAQLF